jgi:hypothetical protein
MHKLIVTLVFQKNANFFAGKWRKWQKLVIIISWTAAILVNLTSPLQ